jgi:DNA helicase HerA-like ATPase
MQSPQLYATFLLWLLSELFEDMPEVGDPEKPKLVFFFDEAHLLFADAPPGLVQKIEQTVKLIRSKGVGVYFVTQNPLDVPESVLAQMGNRIQHALRAYTPREQKAVATAASTFRPNPKFDTEKTIGELGKGEALVSVLDLKGVPTMVERTLIRPPSSRLGTITPAERDTTIKNSPVYGQYEKVEDRESAYEKLSKKAADRAAAQDQAAKQREDAARDKADAERAKADARDAARADRTSRGGYQRETATDRFVKNMASTVGREAGRVGVRFAREAGTQILRGILGGLTRR